MANEEQLAILRQGVEVWNIWRAGHLLAELDLQEADLRGADLRGANFHEVDLHEADLQEADLQEANLRGANLHEADLQWAKLQRADLQEANLRGANLQEANLRGADLHEADLQWADLQWADLRGADLQWADLQWADLQAVDLQRADLRGANLHEADLQEADLRGANLQRTKLFGANMQALIIGETVFVNVDLRGVQGLDMVKHTGPSSIGIDTLYRSQGDIPEVFLRGCGVPDPMIEYARALVLAARPIDYYSCFISYSHADKSFARRLHDALQGQGIRCWLDEHQMLPGHNIFDEVDRGIRLWDKVLFCASRDSLTSWWVDNELNKAFAKEQQLTKQRGRKVHALIPLNLDNALWQWQDGKADEVRSRLAADFTGWKRNHTKFEREFERLVKALQTSEGREEPPKPKL